MRHPVLRPFARALLCAGSIGLCACETGVAEPPPIDCPEGAAPELIRFSESRLASGGRELSALGWRCLLPSGQRHGPSKEWFANGQQSAITEWWNGEKHGRFEMWYSDGQKRAEGEHAHWQAKGTWTTWDREGNVLQQRDFGDPIEKAAGARPPAASGSDARDTGEAAGIPEIPAAEPPEG